MLIIRVQCNLPGRKEEKEESFNLLERVRLMLFVLSYAEISVLYQSYVSPLFSKSNANSLDLESKMACPVSCFFHKGRSQKIKMEI